MKHTPGPWTAGGTTVYGGSGARTTIASTACCGSLTREEDEANARLIAAAPSLRRLLEKVRNYYGDGLDDNDAQEMALHREIACALSDLEGGAK